MNNYYKEKLPIDIINNELDVFKDDINIRKIKDILDNGCDINELIYESDDVLIQKCSPLILAVNCENIEIIKLLLDYGGNLNITEGNRYTIFGIIVITIIHKLYKTKITEYNFPKIKKILWYLIVYGDASFNKGDMSIKDILFNGHNSILSLNQYEEYWLPSKVAEACWVVQEHTKPQREIYALIFNKIKKIILKIFKEKDNHKLYVVKQKLEFTKIINKDNIKIDMDVIIEIIQKIDYYKYNENNYNKFLKKIN